MQLKTIYEIADGIAPFALSREFCEKCNGYDNSGIQLDCGGEIECILFALDLTAGAVEEAKKINASLIITHHPAIYSPLKSLEPTGAGANILACAKAGISVLSCHLNLDFACGGTDETLMRALGGKTPISIMEPLSAGGYGRVYDVAEQPFDLFLKDAQNALGAKRVITYGNAPVKRVASFCGGGMTDESVPFSLASGADTFVSSDPKHHLVQAAVEGGMNVVIFTHYASERVGLQAFMEKIKIESGVACVFYTDERYL